jgi:6-phosphogluconolactonase
MPITRRTFTGGALLSASGLAAARDYIAYVGTYTGPKSKGIYAWRSSGGKLSALGAVAETSSPSFLAIDPSGRHIYAANEVSEFKGEKAGAVSGFSIDRASGRLTHLNTVSSKGPGPCYVSVDSSGKNVLVANYGGGSVAVLPKGSDGKLNDASAFDQHHGSGADQKRQRGPHAHCVKLSPDNKFALVTDLGTDEVMVYRFDPAKGSITANNPPSAKLKPGAGPRHFVFHPKLPRLYTINELNSTITAFDWDAAKGILTDRQSVSTLPEGYSGESTGAEIVIHPNGKFLYGSNRGDDSIAIFAVDSAGALKAAGHVKTQGKVPRNFALDPSGTLLFAANQESDNIVIFRVDTKTGKLTPTGEVLEVASPVCVRFLQV